MSTSLLNISHLLRGSFRHGIHPPENKHFTDSKKIERLPFPPQVVLPLSQHAGKPSVALVRKGQEVARGEPIARADGFISVPLHASVSGVVKDICLMPSAKGPMVESIVLDVYAGDPQEVLYGTDVDVESISPGDFVKAVQDTGLVGLGGAAFPTHVKLAVPEGYKIDTILINGCECEPFLTTDHRLMVEQAAELVEGTRILMRAMGASRGIIGTEDNKLDAVEAIQKVLKPNDTVSVKAVQTKYPQGAEKMLAKALVNREIPSGGLPYVVGLGVYNVATATQIGQLLPHKQGVVERVVTVTGPGIGRPGNYIVPIGTPIRFILEQLGFQGSARHLIMGGPMMGGTVSSLDVPITKGCGGLLILNEHQLTNEEQMKRYPCINCAACVDACPIMLNPCELGRLAHKARYQEMADRYHLNDCFECGSCSYVCPAAIPLVQYFRVAKSVNRTRAAAS
jgi:electron transport complex protein RnfC